MEDLLLYVASSSDERSFAFHCLEIISLMFREQVCVPHSHCVYLRISSNCADTDVYKNRMKFQATIEVPSIDDA